MNSKKNFKNKKLLKFSLIGHKVTKEHSLVMNSKKNFKNKKLLKFAPIGHKVTKDPLVSSKGSKRLFP